MQNSKNTKKFKFRYFFSTNEKFCIQSLTIWLNIKIIIFFRHDDSVDLKSIMSCCFSTFDVLNFSFHLGP